MVVTDMVLDVGIAVVFVNHLVSLGKTGLELILLTSRPSKPKEMDICIQSLRKTMSHLVLSPGLVQFVGCIKNKQEENIRNAFCCFRTRNEKRPEIIEMDDR
jgi:hypothetical protein